MLRTGNTQDGLVIILFEGKKPDGEPFQITTTMKPEMANDVILGLNHAIDNCRRIENERNRLNAN